MSAKASTTIAASDWGLLAILSVLWGGSFFFAGVAVRELPPLSIVLARVAIAALLLIPLHWLLIGALPRARSAWLAFLVMAVLNNVIPFSLIVTGQKEIASGLASVLNATTPLFAVIVMAAFGDEKLIARKVAGVIVGLAGVAILRGTTPMSLGDGATLGVALCLAGALSYGFAGLWGRRHLAGVPPLTSATCQLICSTAVMAALASLVDAPWRLAVPSVATLWSLLGLAALSTALAYVVFFQILVRAGATNVMLVTLLIPLTSILLGHLVLDEAIRPREIVGALVIASSLLIVDGRIFSALRRDRDTSAAP
ncbi:MAG TPA: DMT family transporter [Hyphomicrobiaceae bacterium]|nr:DMT family transporter [Hyphomicrobiaceae bacterium]